MSSDRRYFPKGTLLATIIGIAHDLSKPQGLGILHFKEGPIPDDVLDAIVEYGNDAIPASMDYVLGRAVKLNVFHDADNGQYFIHPPWFDHSDKQLEELFRLCDEAREAA